MLHSVKGHQGFESCASHQASGHGHRLTFFSSLHLAQVWCREAGEMVFSWAVQSSHARTVSEISSAGITSRMCPPQELLAASTLEEGVIHSSSSRLTQSLQLFFWPSWKSLGSRLLINVTVVAQKSQCARYFRGAKKEAIPIPNSLQSNQAGQGKIRRK